MTPTLRLHFREPTIDTNRPIADGIVPIEGFNVQLVAREADADAWDCGFAARMLDFGAEPACISIPAFPNRKFRHAYIFVNTKAGIEMPRDLIGKRVGILNWANTAGIWARDVAKMAGVQVPAGAVEHQYVITEKSDAMSGFSLRWSWRKWSLPMYGFWGA